MEATRLHRCWQLLKYLGPNWLAYRVYHAMRMKSGLIRFQHPITTWDKTPLSSFLVDRSLEAPEQYGKYRRSAAPKFFFDPASIADFQPVFERWDSVDCSPGMITDDILNGSVPFFSHEIVDVGLPPRWHVDPFTGFQFPVDRHWSQIPDFAAGDVKIVWETNRFGFVFALVRSYWRTGDSRFAELFWQFVESWYEANPPQAGVNWKCGQEISLRVIAWCFGLYGFGTSSATTNERVTKLARMIATSGQRIECNIGYALSQKNNHGMSEAMGLWTIGSLFPEFVDAARWSALGRRLLESQAEELIYSDGSFSQHSMNYHRVMLHVYLWSIRLGDVLEQPFSTHLRNRIAKAGEFVYQLQDEHSGCVPCYGQDDGALILPLSNCGYRDFRPVVQATHFLTTGRRRFEMGPWDEDSLWLFGKSAVESRELTDHVNSGTEDPLILNTLVPGRREGAEPTSRNDFDARDGGYMTLRSPTGFAFTRAANFRHRPAQADMLHVDIWWRGLNIAIDPGTYSYNSPPPWDNRFAHTSYHNTVTVDGTDQMERASRFLWLPWIDGKSFGRNVARQGDVSCWNGEHDGYRRLTDPIVHRRGIVRLGLDHWLIVDSLQGQQPHLFRLHWLLSDAPYELEAENRCIELETSMGRYRVATVASVEDSKFEVIRAAEDSAIGWRSSSYHARQPAIAICLAATAANIVFATVLGPDANQPTIEHDIIKIICPDWGATVTLNLANTSGEPLVTSINADGSLAIPVPSIVNQTQRSFREIRRCTYC